MAKCVASCRYAHPELGRVKVTVRSNARHFTATWRSGELAVSVPPGVTVDEYERVLSSMMPRLLAKKPAASLYSVGQVFEAAEFTVVIREDASLRGYVAIRKQVDNPDGRKCFAIMVPAGVDFASPAVERIIARDIIRIGECFAPMHLLPLARAEAERTRCRVKEWGVGRGSQRLGVCRADGRISLSGIVMYLPHDLRRLVICHELAHLTHMNHSAAFHALVDVYLDGREAELEACLRKFPLPTRHVSR